jgi:hypothetical protein
MKKVYPSVKKRKYTATVNTKYLDISINKPEQIAYHLMLEQALTGSPEIALALSATHSKERMLNFRGHIASIFWNAISDASNMDYHNCSNQQCGVVNLKIPRGVTVLEKMDMKCKQFQRLCNNNNKNGCKDFHAAKEHDNANASKIKALEGHIKELKA